MSGVGTTGPTRDCRCVTRVESFFLRQVWLRLLLLAATCAPGPQAHWGRGSCLWLLLVQSFSLQPADLILSLPGTLDSVLHTWHLQAGRRGTSLLDHSAS